MECLVIRYFQAWYHLLWSEPGLLETSVHQSQEFDLVRLLLDYLLYDFASKKREYSEPESVQRPSVMLAGHLHCSVKCCAICDGLMKWHDQPLCLYRVGY